MSLCDLSLCLCVCVCVCVCVYVCMNNHGWGQGLFVHTNTTVGTLFTRPHQSCVPPSSPLLSSLLLPFHPRLAAYACSLPLQKSNSGRQPVHHASPTRSSSGMHPNTITQLPRSHFPHSGADLIWPFSRGKISIDVLINMCDASWERGERTCRSEASAGTRKKLIALCRAVWAPCKWADRAPQRCLLFWLNAFAPSKTLFTMRLIRLEIETTLIFPARIHISNFVTANVICMLIQHLRCFCNSV